MEKNEVSKIDKLHSLTVHSDEWFNLAFDGLENVPDFAKIAVQRIFHSHSTVLKGASPAYFANVIRTAYNQSQGLYTIEEFWHYVNQNQKNPPGVNKVIVQPGYLDVIERFKNCKLLRLRAPYMKLVQVGENLQLFWTDINEYPTTPSWFWLTESVK